MNVEPLPQDMPEEWRAYFDRILNELTIDIGMANTFPPSSKLPTTPIKGRIYYFNNVISPDITAAGWWGWNGTTWNVIG